MDKEFIEKRIADIEVALPQALSQYNMLLGRLDEAKYFLESLNAQQLVDNNPGKVVKK